MKNIKNSVLIFAGPGGLGLEICKKFLLEDFNVFFTSQNNLTLVKTLKLLKKNNKVNKNNIIKGFSCNATNENNIKTCLKKFFKQDIKKSIIINCIGSFDYDGIASISLKKLTEIFKINTIPTILISKYTSVYKKKTDKIGIFSIGSSSSYDGFYKTIAYCASKHALLGAIKSLNKELIKKNIYNVNINPGSIKTKMGKKVKNQKYSEFISPVSIANFIFDLSKLKEPAFIEDVFLKRIVK